ncbi:hypothetical protein TSOC111612_11605 [Tsukamurella ocularis]
MYRQRAITSRPSAAETGMPSARTPSRKVVENSPSVPSWSDWLIGTPHSATSQSSRRSRVVLARPWITRTFTADRHARPCGRTSPPMISDHHCVVSWMRASTPSTRRPVATSWRVVAEVV